jgi:hypothetical protein
MSAIVRSVLSSRHAAVIDQSRRLTDQIVKSMATSLDACRASAALRLSVHAPIAHDSDEVLTELTEARRLVADLRSALATRDLIWEAKTIIAAASGCEPAEAHRLLVAQSQHQNRKLRDIATEIVEHHRRTSGGGGDAAFDQASSANSDWSSRKVSGTGRPMSSTQKASFSARAITS